MGADAEAIEAVYRVRYRGFCAALATVTGSHESARDAVQGGLCNGSLEAWIWRIALNAHLADWRVVEVQR